ncbi:hypothetical protein BJF79_15505 [Actinomadura sp. CNU-125]|uniref:hypothetical protein n=1 Tax=Actinomadura sp. CNU-125 TaxID=1904961 RepID=UPI0009613A9F|nr:hypothetical protein [Actinomadura sp. CNU-125]OLT21670.1 hypothetical protein BJF79_15505 [Actinomadura sp. CNU-125]
MSTATAVPAIAVAIIALGWAIARIARAGDDLPALCDVRDERIDALPPDHTDGLTWDPRWDEEPRPGTGPRRHGEVL